MLTNRDTYTSYADREKGDRVVSLFYAAKSKFLFKEKHPQTFVNYYYMSKANATRLVQYMLGDNQKLPSQGMEMFVGTEGDYDLWISLYDGNLRGFNLTCEKVTGKPAPKAELYELRLSDR